MVEFEIFATSFIIGGSSVAYQIGYVAVNPGTVESVSFSRERFQILKIDINVLSERISTFLPNEGFEKELVLNDCLSFS